MNEKIAPLLIAVKLGQLCAANMISPNVCAQIGWAVLIFRTWSSSSLRQEEIDFGEMPRE